MLFLIKKRMCSIGKTCFGGPNIHIPWEKLVFINSVVGSFTRLGSVHSLLFTFLGSGNIKLQAARFSSHGELQTPSLEGFVLEQVRGWFGSGCGWLSGGFEFFLDPPL